jgi:hypothetical protein
MFGLQWEEAEEEVGVEDAGTLRMALERGQIQNVDGSALGLFGVPRLIEACQKGKVESVALLLSHNASPNITHLNGDSALHSLFKMGKAESPAVRLLLEHGADVVQVNAKGIPAFALCPSRHLPLFTEIMEKRLQDTPEYFLLAFPSFQKSAPMAHSLASSGYIQWMSFFFRKANLLPPDAPAKKESASFEMCSSNDADEQITSPPSPPSPPTEVLLEVREPTLQRMANDNHFPEHPAMESYDPLCVICMEEPKDCLLQPCAQRKVTSGEGISPRLGPKVKK